MTCAGPSTRVDTNASRATSSSRARSAAPTRAGTDRGGAETAALDVASSSRARASVSERAGSPLPADCLGPTAGIGASHQRPVGPGHHRADRARAPIPVGALLDSVPQAGELVAGFPENAALDVE